MKPESKDIPVVKYILCPFCGYQNIEAKPGKTHCPKCHTSFFIDDRVECVFGDTAALKLPLAGTICPVCGLIQGEESEHCVYCNAKLNFECELLLIVSGAGGKDS